MSDPAPWPDVRQWHRPLLLVAAVTAPFVVISLVGTVLDDRVLVGAPIWAKPFKFAVSIVLYAVTWSWLLAGLRRHRLARWAGTVIAVALLVEYVVIVGQAVRGRQSHFNVATPLDATLWGIMGSSIAVLFVANVVVAAVLVRRRVGPRPLTWAVRAGAAISLFGIGIAFLMTGPTPAQRQSLRDGTFTGVVGAHSVGVTDGGPVLPVTGWSTTGGDLRIAHFVGIHALQALPLLAVLLTLLAARLPLLRDEDLRTRLVLVAAGGYAGLTCLVLWQALRGQPLLRPDGATLAAAGALIALVAAGTAAVVIAGRRGARRPSTPGPAAGGRSR
ncbi:hypothetical protein ACU610_07965 [Geodermatophilus sp. URMC 61]|uniref:hypothetical protein n=1 Tax=Geodermatophilus sp. URMC 61 TaxID=3423411 RepID=UPI00406C2E96